MNCATVDAFFPPSWGVFHSSEQSFLFAPWARCRRSTDGEEIAEAWGAFFDGLLQRGVPDDIKGLEWPRYERGGAHPRLLIGNFDNRSRPLLSVTYEDESAYVCDFWDAIFRVGSDPFRFREDVLRDDDARASASVVDHKVERLRGELSPPTRAALLPIMVAIALMQFMQLWRWFERRQWCSTASTLV